MKKISFILTMIFALALTACGSTSTETSTLTADYENAISVQLQLSAGTFSLEGTDLAVDAAQAADLTPLWQVLNSLNESDAAAPEEIDALVSQIQETMTSEQIEAIAAMQLTMEEMGTIMQEYGLTSGMGTGETPPEGFVPGSGRDSDVPGMSSGGGGGGGDTTGMPPEQIEAAQAEREESGASDMINSRLATAVVDGLITLLESTLNDN
ncbi:MAG: hypothetical protein HN922_12145 [Anaerolineae bacterium]|nr:hypothetical protein [Anaerolineae bacterium]